MCQTSNEEIAKVFNRNAHIYDRWMAAFERHVAVGARAWAVSTARGEVVEIGVGSGLNLPLYSSRVRHVIGVDLSAEMLAIARRRVAEWPIDRIQLNQGDAQALNLPSDSADTFVSTFTFCTIPDPLAAPLPYLTSAGFTVTEVHRGGPGGIVFRILAHKQDT